MERLIGYCIGFGAGCLFAAILFRISGRRKIRELPALNSTLQRIRRLCGDWFATVRSEVKAVKDATSSAIIHLNAQGENLAGLMTQLKRQSEELARMKDTALDFQSKTVLAMDMLRGLINSQTRTVTVEPETEELAESRRPTAAEAVQQELEDDMSKRKVYHLTYSRAQKHWQLKLGAVIVYAHRVKAVVEAEARKTGNAIKASGGLAQVIVHKKNGVIITEWTYGRDPKRFKG